MSGISIFVSMNVVDEEIDIWSLKGKEDCGCCTHQERHNFNLHLVMNDMIDTWRYLHPNERGWRLSFSRLS
jgi:exonuclease III